MKKLISILTVVLTFGAVAVAANTFDPQDSSTWTPEEKAVITYIKSVGYKNADTITELDILNPSTSFTFQVASGDICMGDVQEDILRCKNAMGIETFDHNGDAD